MLVTHISVAGVTADSPISLEPINVIAVEQSEQQDAEIAQSNDVDEAQADKEGSNKGLTTDEIVRAYFADSPEMYDVAWCESRVRQYKENGSVLRGYVDSNDVGVMQINERYHLERAEELGYNIYSLEGNLAYAKLLYEDQGLQPWSASKPCWSGRSQIAQR
ncbi:MAG: hypothetical protein WDZ82_00240 [Candidatus Paceibacterota bacterium]